MKRKYLAKMFAMAMAAVMVFGSNGLSALAADGTEADAPKDEAGVKPSSGKAVAEREGDVWKVTDDDDATAAENDSETNISIWAKVVEHGDYVYKVDISWGAMKFEFNNQAGKWNTEQHIYEAVEGGVGAEWTEDGYIDGTNNKITVVNHSNWAVDTNFTYNHEGTAFNKDSNSANAVRGHFFLENDAAKVAAKVLTDSARVDNALTEVLTLGHQDASNAVKYGGSVNGEDVVQVTTNEEGSCERDVFFTFNGTPDSNDLDEAIKTDFTKVGVITVTISPWVNDELGT